ncbi:MAG: hypothetical protein IKD46_08575 [Lentisphaeria bacterium]|nr:hypothetical protein [Lentisphaeria bacterium]
MTDHLEIPEMLHPFPGLLQQRFFQRKQLRCKFACTGAGAINGIRIRNTSELSAVLEDMHGGDIVVLTVNRAGKELDISLELGWG